MVANGNIFVVRARVAGATPARFAVDEEGDLFAVNATITAMDEYDDRLLTRAYERTVAPSGIIDSTWDKYVHYNEQTLVELGILGAPIADGGLWNVTRHMRMLNGATWQNFTDIKDMQTDIEMLQTRIELLQAETRALPDARRGVLEAPL